MHFHYSEGTLTRCENDDEGNGPCPICRSENIWLQSKPEVRKHDDDPRTEKEKRYAPYECYFLWDGPVGGRMVFPNAEARAEYKRAWSFFYNRQPEVKLAKKAYMAAWRQFPEVKAYEKAYRDAYRAIPEVRERDNALRKLRHARAKEKHGG